MSVHGGTPTRILRPQQTTLKVGRHATPIRLVSNGHTKYKVRMCPQRMAATHKRTLYTLYLNIAYNCFE